MPIAARDVYTKFVIVPQTMTCREVTSLLATRQRATRRTWYLVVRLNAPSPLVVARAEGGYTDTGVLSPGYAVILPIKELPEAEAQQGETIVDRTLAQVPGLLIPALIIECQTMSVDRAKRDWLPKSPGRRLLVVDKEQPLGLLKDEQRGGGFGGFMIRLFGQERQRTNIAKGRYTYRCPQCPAGENSYDFADLLDPATNRLICPRGHLIEE